MEKFETENTVPPQTAYIEPPGKIPFYIRIALWIAKKTVKKDLLLPKLLAWYPKTAFASGIMESLVCHGDKEIPKRLLKLIRVRISIKVSCPFCIDMNAFEYEKCGITKDEILTLTQEDISSVAFFSDKEKAALEYTDAVSATPIEISGDLICRLKENFSERAIVILAGTIAQVNYWTRMIRALGVPEAGFMNECELIKK